MENWLVKHALDNIWCQPSNDRRWILQPGRITPDEGRVHGMQATGFSIRFPIEQKWFHCFHLGKLNHRSIGIEDLWDGWSRLDRVLNYSGTLITLYNAEGRTFPLEFAWIRKQPNGNVLIAVEMMPNQIDFSNQPMFIRFYDGYFRYTDQYTSEHKSEVVGKLISDAAARFNIVKTFNDMRAKQGEPIAYINGYEVDLLRSEDIKLWDYVEIVRDGLIRSIEYIRLADVKSYTSEMDGCRKYLLHLPKQMETIHCINDIDLSILKGNNGRYYHQHKSSALRQLTHNDYAIPANRITDMIASIPEWSIADELTVKVITRYSGMDRPLIYNVNRTHELYKLTDEQICNAIAGNATNVEEWRGSNLERTGQAILFTARYESITNERATDAYGYNAVSHYAADTPTKTEIINGETVAMLPPLLAASSTVYEYDADGLLLGYYNHIGTYTDWYTCRNPEAVLVEAIQGQGGKVLDITWDATNYKVEDGFNYRFYTNKLLSGEPSDEFEDITDTPAYSIDPDGTVVWNLDLTRRRPVVWRDSNFLAYGLELDMFQGTAKLTIDHWFEDGHYEPFPFVPEKIELWMNGHTLIPDVDYYVKYPNIVICSKEYLTTDETRHRPWIDVRVRGQDTEVRKPKVGFVVNNLISNNAAFDVRDDKVVRIAVAGKVLHRDDVTFREDTALGVSSLLNGRPYMVDDPTIPLRKLVTGRTYLLRDAARKTDHRIEDYLSVWIPTPEDIEHNPVTGFHRLFSPILNDVIHDILNGDLVPTQDDDNFYVTTEQFDTIMQDYMYLLDYEPSLNGIDMRYVDLHPHDGLEPIELTPIQFALVERINNRYLANRVLLNKHIHIKA